MCSGHVGFTCEDADRDLEHHPARKVRGVTAIPCGTYPLVRAWSPKFKRTVLMIAEVPTHGRVYLHGGNDAGDTLGCPLVGAERTERGVKHCSAVVAWLEREVPEGSTIEIRRAPGAILAVPESPPA